MLTIQIQFSGGEEQTILLRNAESINIEITQEQAPELPDLSELISSMNTLEFEQGCMDDVTPCPVTCDEYNTCLSRIEEDEDDITLREILEAMGISPHHKRHIG
ncbi:MAG: hypothetical protein ACOX2M_03630 [Fastidiosipilaceae bacterium]|jgi:hypothetical protein